MTNFLLAAIAVGIWVNVALAISQGGTLASIRSSASEAASWVSYIGNGNCNNHKIC